MSSRRPKILAVASAVDLDFRYGCTPAWWQLWKGLYQAGCDLIVTPYRGRPVESPWWRTEPNPCYREGELFEAVRTAVARTRGDRYLRREESHPPDRTSDRIAREAIWRWVTPRWQRHLVRILERERNVDAVIVFTVPLNHLRGIPTFLRERFGVPIVFYDGDVPMSLPEFGGMDTGFSYYLGGDPSEYDLVVSNSEGGLERLRELGARRAESCSSSRTRRRRRPLTASCSTIRPGRKSSAAPRESARSTSTRTPSVPAASSSWSGWQRPRPWCDDRARTADRAGDRSSTR